jgi:hyperosmotically inducible protein
MKKWNSLLILSATLAILSIILSGCNRSESAVNYANEEVEIKDSVVTSRVEQSLVADERLSRLDLTVLTRKGDVLLMGVVDNQNYINDVNTLVRRIEGVHTLHNHLSVQ